MGRPLTNDQAPQRTPYNGIEHSEVSAFREIFLRTVRFSFAEAWRRTVDSEVRQQIEAVLMKLGEAYNKHDLAAITALYTQNAVQVWDWDHVGPFYGQQAIEKHYAAHYVPSPEFVDKLVQVSAIGNKISAISEYSVGPYKGYNARIYVRDADTWKILMEYQIYPR